MDLVCGFQSNFSSGTRSMLLRVVGHFMIELAQECLTDCHGDSSCFVDG